MGGKLTKPLSECSALDLSSVIKESLGPVYAGYASSIVENAVDGALVCEMDETEFQETLEDLGITSRLHGRVLTKEWKRSKNYSPSIDLEESGGARNQYEAAAEYQLTSKTPDSELTAFHEIVETVRRASKKGFIYSAVNLISRDEQVGIATRVSIQGSVISDRISFPADDSQCVALVLDKETPNYVEKEVSKTQLSHMKSILPPGCESPHYCGHVVRSQSGERIGMVCLVEEDDSGVGNLERKQILQHMAYRTEEQLEVRKLLLQRNLLLKQQVNPNEGGSSRLLASLRSPSSGFSTLSPPRASWFPTPNEIAESGEPRRSAVLPLLKQNSASSKDELGHLPSDYFDIMDMSMNDQTPIGKDDRERVAAVEAMGLKYIDPASPTAQAIRNTVKMASILLDAPLAEVTYLTHDKQYALARYVDAPDQIEQAWNHNVYTSVKANIDDSTPFLCSTARQGALCNYVAAAKKTFVVHDIHADESFKWMRDLPGDIGPRFYSGSPIIVHGEVLATLCVLDWRARPDFTIAHEIQQEQLAACLGREIENYMLRRQMEELERQRNMFALKAEKTAPPEHEAAIVFTDVQGSTTLWEANPDAMQAALSLHDDITRRLCSEFHGYEVKTEGDAFHMAFHDSIDAVGFALKLQEELHCAPWDEDILALPDAAEVNGFRGLRVRVAIHFGPVNRRTNELSGRSEYTGETVHVAKSLEDLATGGQILVSQDTWGSAAYLAETTLGSPQVIDIGKHVMLTGKTSRDGIIAKQLYQLLPSSLAYDYFGRRIRQQEAHETTRQPKRLSTRGSPNGRKFPPLPPQKRLSASFHDAPAQETNIVTIAFVYTSEIEKQYEDATFVLAQLTELIGSILQREKQLGGYQCQNMMLAFSDQSAAVQFGLCLLNRLSQNAVDDRDLSRAVKVGIYEGEYASMGPHQTSGRADYFGICVNRAARVANASGNGQVCVGVIASEDPPNLVAGLSTQFLGRKQLKGVQDEFALFSCSLERSRSA